MKNSFTKSFTMISAFRILAEITQFFQHLLLFLFVRKFLLVITFLNLLLLSLLINIYVSSIFLLSSSCAFFIVHNLFIDLKILCCHFFESSWWFANFFQPCASQLSIVLMKLPLWVDLSQKIIYVNFIISIKSWKRKLILNKIIDQLSCIIH